MRFMKALDQGPFVPGPLADWGLFTRLIEIGEDLYAVRHIDVFTSGRFLRYDRIHWVDGFGMLAGAWFGWGEIKRPEWQIQTIGEAEFELEWEAAGRSPQWPLQVASAKMVRWGLVPVWLRQRQNLDLSPP